MDDAIQAIRDKNVLLRPENYGTAQQVFHRPMSFVMKVPRELGPITRLFLKAGKVIAETKSGIPMIVPTRSNEERDA